MSQFKTIGLMGRVEKPGMRETLERIGVFLLQRKLAVMVETELLDVIDDNSCLQSVASGSRSLLGDECDLVIVIGGDGSMLGAARALVLSGTPVVGVNRGRLGFLTDILPDEVETRLDDILNGHYISETRFLLEVTVTRDDEQVGMGTAFNDVVVSSGEIAQMIAFETYIDNEFVYSQRADGLIISTPTGSTAYSLSAGGPIMHPKLNALLLVPMFPHTLSSRPIVIDGDSHVSVVVSSSHGIDPVITCDGHTRIIAKPQDVINISKKTELLTLIHPADHSYYAAYRNKLRWSDRLDANKG